MKVVAWRKVDPELKLIGRNLKGIDERVQNAVTSEAGGLDLQKSSLIKELTQLPEQLGSFTDQFQVGPVITAWLRRGMVGQSSRLARMEESREVKLTSLAIPPSS